MAHASTLTSTKSRANSSTEINARANPQWNTPLGLALLGFPALLLVSGLSLTIGAMDLELSTVAAVFQNLIWEARDSSSANAQVSFIVLELRSPRTVLAILVGASLAASGAALQGLFRNPLADPGLIGVSSGAALGAVGVIVLGDTLLNPWVSLFGIWSQPLAAFSVGLLTTIVIYRIATRFGKTNIATLLLAGLAINAIAAGLIGVLTYLADDYQLRELTFWNMGSLGRADWQAIVPSIPLMIVPLLVLFSFSKALNCFLMGETVAEHVGFSVHKIKALVIILTSLSVAAAVSLCGVIGFVGLIIPHCVRQLIGADHRQLLPACMLLGSCFLVCADMAARTIAAPAEIPIGLIMGIVGGPFFLFLLLRNYAHS